MANFDAAKALFAQVDANKDGCIDENEFRAWLSNNKRLTPSYQLSTGEYTRCDDNSINQYNINSQNNRQSRGDANVSHETATVFNDEELYARNTQQTNLHSSKSFGCIYKDPNPQIIRRPAAVDPVTYHQKVVVRFLQPPPIPPPDPMIIKEVRPPQPPPLPPLRIRQVAPAPPQLPPLILRERPPQPPSAVASKTITRCLPPIPMPPRSIIIERIPHYPQKPRDIIIERWIPYGPLPKRRTIVQHAPAPRKYPPPRNCVIVYEPVQARVIRQFQKVGITREDPQVYKTRYGESLLDSTELVQVARNAGVIEDIAPPAISSSTPQSTNNGHTDISNHLNRTISESLLSARTTNFQGMQPFADNTNRTNHGNSMYWSSNLVDNNTLARSASMANPGFNLSDTRCTLVDMNHGGI